MFNPFFLLFVLVTPPLVAPLLLVWFCRLFGEGAAHVGAKILLILFGSVFVIALAVIALFADELRNGQTGDDALVALGILAAVAGALGTRAGLASLRGLGLLGNPLSPASGG